MVASKKQSKKASAKYLTLAGLIAVASRGYSDNYLADLYNRRVSGGDGLAEFLVTELSETFEVDQSREYQLARAAAVVNVAIEELTGVKQALKKEYARS